MRFLTCSSVLSLLLLLILPQTAAQDSLSLIPQASDDTASIPPLSPEYVGIHDHLTTPPGACGPEPDNNNNACLIRS